MASLAGLFFFLRRQHMSSQNLGSKNFPARVGRTNAAVPPREGAVHAPNLRAGQVHARGLKFMSQVQSPTEGGGVVGG